MLRKRKEMFRKFYLVIVFAKSWLLNESHSQPAWGHMEQNSLPDLWEKKKKKYGSLHFLMERQMILMKKDVDYRSKIWGIENE